MGIPIPLLNTEYRLSRSYSAGGGGYEEMTYNRIILYTDDWESSSPYFVEGFEVAELIMEQYNGNTSFRKQTLTPQQLFHVTECLRIIGDVINDPVYRERLSLTPTPWGLESDVEQAWDALYNANLRYCDASHGTEVIVMHNGVDGTNNTDVSFYDRDWRKFGQRNMLAERAQLTPTPHPESIAEPVLDSVEQP